MEPPEIKNLVEIEVKKQLAIEKKKIAKKIHEKFIYTGEFAKARWLIDIFDEWARDL